jgi:mismatch-specific thymine-DNA glycosylase
MTLMQPNETSSGGGLPDILAPGLSVVFCGINPPSTAAQIGLHFASRTNRFWRVLHRAGFTPHPIEPQEAMSLLSYGYGLTVAVTRPTPGANDLSRSELKQAKGVLDDWKRQSRLGTATGALRRSRSMGAPKPERTQSQFQLRCAGQGLLGPKGCARADMTGRTIVHS